MEFKSKETLGIIFAIIAYFSFSILDAVQKTNTIQVNKIVKLVEKELVDLKNKQITILGLSFKEESDDIRESVSIKLIKKLLKELIFSY